MQDYQNFLGFLGSPLQSEELQAHFQAFVTQAKSILSKLGDKDYLLYRYLEQFFSLQTHRNYYNATDDGFEACARAMRFCNAITKGKPVCEEDIELKAFATEHSEKTKNQEQNTRSTLLLWHVFSQFIQPQSVAYYDELVNDLSIKLDARRVEDYYNDMKSVLGGDTELIKLQECMKKAFFPVTFMQAFNQSAINGFVGHLVDRDDETSKPIIQLILEA